MENLSDKENRSKPFLVTLMDYAFVRWLKNILTPNQSVTKKTEWILWIFWAVVGFVTWEYLMPVVIPRPMEVLTALQSLYLDSGLAEHLWNTFSMQVQAMLIAIVLSLVLAYSFTFPIMRPVVKFLSTLRFISPGPLVIFLLLTVRPDGENLKLMLFVFAMTVWYLTSMAQVVASVPITEFRHAYTLRMNELQTVKEVIIYGRAHEAWEMLRQNSAMMWAMVPMVEALIRSGGGIGMLYANENKHLMLPEMMAIIIILFLYGICMDLFFQVTGKKLFPYAFTKLGGTGNGK